MTILNSVFNSFGQTKYHLLPAGKEIIHLICLQQLLFYVQVRINFRRAINVNYMYVKKY